MPLIGQLLSERLGQSFVVENRPGAAGTIGVDAVVRAPADGYTLLLTSGNDAYNEMIYPDVLRRRTSRTFRIDNLSAGIGPPLRTAKEGPCPAQTADNAPRLTLSTGWPLSVGIGGRFASDSAANGCSLTIRPSPSCVEDRTRVPISNG
jgi:hypothetical protein